MIFKMTFLRFDFFWPLKVAGTILLGFLIFWYTQPTEMCFDTESFNDRSYVTLNDTVYKVDQPGIKIQPRRICLAIDAVKHKFCPKESLGADHKTLCLGWSRQLTAIFTQLTLYIIFELVNIIFLPKCQHPMQVIMILMVLPIVQAALMGTIFLINGGLILGWSNQWKNANFDFVPSIPLPSYTMTLCGILITLKVIEAAVLSVEYHKSGMNIPIVQNTDHKLK